MLKTKQQKKPQKPSCHHLLNHLSVLSLGIEALNLHFLITSTPKSLRGLFNCPGLQAVDVLDSRTLIWSGFLQQLRSGSVLRAVICFLSDPVPPD